jgi:hypothetical protein
MEGPTVNRVPRTELDRPVEVRTSDAAMHSHSNGSTANISVRGLFVPGDDLPVGTTVRVKVSGHREFEAEGVVRRVANHGRGGIGIEFTNFYNGNRQRLLDVIEELTRRGLPAA